MSRLHHRQECPAAAPIAGFIEAASLVRGFRLIAQRGKARRQISGVRKRINFFTSLFPVACDLEQGRRDALLRLNGSNTIPEQDSNGNLAVKLLRTFAAQTEALQRYRGKGQQKVTVEHVHVHTGGQAIVGSVSQSGGGRE
jgi:hypothetical protein